MTDDLNSGGNPNWEGPPPYDPNQYREFESYKGRPSTTFAEANGNKALFWGYQDGAPDWDLGQGVSTGFHTRPGEQYEEGWNDSAFTHIPHPLP